ncbi:MAG: response regulator transcription factor [Candidatus Aminicenantes bacterium]|nr:response regulator transcription factor [Candidatus Aminicenantes bacterium]
MRILVVEDDRKVGAFLQKGLREEQFAVDVCGDGEEALAQARLFPYDLIILDVMLPKKDGFEVCRELRRGGLNVPVLMLTAKDSVEDKVAGLSEGADDYLAKPFAFEELLARTRALLRRSRDYQPSAVRVGDLELDPSRRQAVRACRNIPLTGKEYALLEYLMRNAGRVVTETMILEHVWDMNYEGSSNVVSVYVNYLRRKIDGGADVKMIHTLRGHGYLLEAHPED